MVIWVAEGTPAMWFDSTDQQVSKSRRVMLKLFHSYCQELIHGGGEADNRHI